MPIKREMLVRRDALDQVAINETLLSDLGLGDLGLGDLGLGDLGLGDLGPGDQGGGSVLLEIESFAVTANNVTYAVVGDQLGYWNFFPAAESWGIVPVWGHARVLASRHREIAVGERVYGYLPMASHLLVEPGHVAPDGFRDMAAHRQPMSPIYNHYRRLAADPAHDPEREGERALFAPLFTTSFLIAAQLRRANWHGAETLIVTSASSKTAMAAAWIARVQSPGICRIGLTSMANVAFVEATGLYDAVLAYAAIEELDIAGRAMLIDFAGNMQLLHDLYAALPGRLAGTLRVGVTHHDERAGAGPPLEPKPIWFFAPDVASALAREIGADAFNAALAASWSGFVEAAGAWITIEHGAGAESLQRVWREQLGGRARPDLGYIQRLS